MIDEFLATPAAQQLGARLGLQPGQMEDAARKALPVALSQLQKFRATEGEEATAGVVNQVAIDPDQPDAPEQALNQPNERVDQLLGARSDALGGLLGNLLGGGGEAGGHAKGREILGSVLPLLLGFLQKKGIGNTGGGGLLGGLAGMLDKDKDGSALDEISEMILGKTAPQTDGQMEKKGGLGGMLGSIFGK